MVCKLACCWHAAPTPAGTLDQGVGTLEVFEAAEPDALYPSTLQTFDNLARVVDSLMGRTAKITAGA